MNLWVAVRVGAMVLAAIVAWRVPLRAPFDPPLNWPALWIIFAFFPVVLPIIIGLQRFNPRSGKVWRRPSWKVNPLSFRDPILILHFAAILAITQGITVLSRLLLTARPIFIESLVPLAMGAGAWLGVRLTIVIYKAKFLESS